MKILWVDGKLTIKHESDKELEFLLTVDQAVKKLRSTEEGIRIEGHTYIVPQRAEPE